MSTAGNDASRVDSRVANRDPGQIVLLVIAIATVGFMSWLPWIEVRAGSERVSASGAHLPWVRWVVLAWDLALVIAAVDVVRHQRKPMNALTFAAGMLAIVSGVLVLVVELVAGVLPTNYLPDLVEDAGAGLSAGPGLWGTFVGSLFVVAATITLTRRSARSRPVQTVPRIGDRATMLAGSATAAATLVVVIARELPWVSWTIGDEHGTIAGAEIPVVRTISLLLLGALVVATVPALLLRGKVGPLVAATLSGFIAVLGAVLGATLLAAGSRLPSFLIPNGVNSSASVRPGAWVWIAVVAATVACGADLALLGLRTMNRRAQPASSPCFSVPERARAR